MRTPEFDRLIADFSQKSELIKKRMTDMLHLVADGKVPADQDMSALDKAVDSLRDDYDSICLLTKETILESELPDIGSSILEYVTAMETSEKKRITEKLKSIKSTLIQFLSVRSFVDAYAQALAPHQTTANSMLEKLKSLPANSIPNEIIEASNSHKLFLTAMEISDFGSDSAIELLDSLDKIYPSRIQVGLAQKKYYLPEKTKFPADDTDICIISTSKHEADCDQIESSLQDKAPSTSLKKEKELTKIDTILLTSKYRFKTGKASASSFKSDILKMPDSIRAILPLFTNFGALTVDQVARFGECMDCFDNAEVDSISGVMEMLATKGYVTAYDVDSMCATAYCISLIGYACMRKDTIAVKLRKFWRIPYGSFKFLGSEQMDEALLTAVITNNALLLSYLQGIKDQVSDEDYASAKASIEWVEDHYRIAVPWNGKQHMCTIFGSLFAAQSLGHEHLLLITDELPKEPTATPNSQSQIIFAYAKGTLCRLDGEWIALSSEENAAVISADDDFISDYDEMTDAINKIPVQDEPTTDILTQISPELIVSDQSELSNTQELADTSDDPTEKECPQISGDLKESPLFESIQEHIISSRVPTDDEFINIIYSLLGESGKQHEEDAEGLINAILLSKAASYISDNKNCQTLYQQLALATGLFQNESDYSGMAIVPAFSEYSKQTEGMMLSTFSIALLAPVQKHDYLLYSRAKALHDDYENLFPSYVNLKPLFHKLISIEDIAPEGFSDSIIGLLGDDAEKTTFLKKLQENAISLLSTPTIKAKMNGLPELCSSCFGPNSALHLCMEAVSEDNYSDKGFVAEVLAEYSSDNELQQRIDREWNEATKGKRTNKLPLSLLARRQVEDAFKKRLSLMKAWVEHVDNRDDKSLPKLKNLRVELLQLLVDAQTGISEKAVCGNDHIMLWGLEFMRNRLSGEDKLHRPFAELLSTGHISLDDDWNPVLDASLADMKYYEPWRNVLRHITTPKQSLEQVKEQIVDVSSRLFDNLRQLEQIGKLLDSDSDACTTSKSDLEQAIASAENYAKTFTDKLEMAFTYNRIDETDKENLLANLTQYKESLLATRDFACWRAFVNALEQQVNEISESRKKQLRIILGAKRAALPADAVSSLLDEAERLLEEDSNYAVAEEYINRFDNGETELSEKLYSVLHDADSFSDFVSERVFVPLYEACMKGAGRALKSFGADLLDKHLPEDWTSRLRENSRKMLEAWPAAKGMYSASQLSTLFQSIGLNATRTEKINNPKVELYQLHVTKLARYHADYTHPIATFGTQLKSPLHVVVLFGSFTAKQLVDTVTSLDLGGMTVVLIDRAYDLPMRRQMAEIFRTETSRQNPFLLIDRVLLLYMAMHQETERLPIMLKCTLPYTVYQPFVRDSGSTADEMFCGRTRELSEIINPGGACVVYGGRQLGKTALLERAESRCSKPQNKEYAVYSNIIGCRCESDFVSKIVGDINKKTNLSLRVTSGIKELCHQLDLAFRNNSIVTLLLLLDEADNFLAAISNESYTPLQPLIDLKRESKNDFKFVFTGLHNVCRAQNATANNGIFGQLGTPLCIKPLSPTDALLLISRPLRYLGFQIDQYPHLETILTNTNYYPGILQFFGNTLVQTFNTHYARYYRAVDGHPPFTLRDEQLGAVMNSADLNKSIRKMLILSLDLDPRYFMLARCVTMLYHLSDGNVPYSLLGFSVDKIRSIAGDYSIRCLENENRSSCLILLDEMVDMGILSKPKEEIYRLRRHSFLNIVGSDMDKLDEEIVRVNEEEAV